MNKIFEELEARKRDMVKRFCDDTPFDQADTAFCQNHGLVFNNGDRVSLTEYGRSYLAPGPDSDITRCPDDDSHLPQPGRLDFGISSLARGGRAAAQEELNRQVRGVLDVVNHPPHYKQGDVECIDAIKAALTEEEYRGYCKGNALKCIWRERHKGGAESLQKADWYLNRLVK